MQIPCLRKRQEGEFDASDTEAVLKTVVFIETVLAILWLTIELWPF